MATVAPADTFGSFKEFVEQVIMPMHALNPADERLDGQPSGGNREVVGTFFHAGRPWKVHADTHYDRLLLAFDALGRGAEDPFIQQRTPRGNSLDLNPVLRGRAENPGYKYLYIYEL
jgi:hypothetical protein